MCPSVSLVLMVNEGDRSPRFKSLAPRRARRPPAKPHEQNRFNSFWQKKWKQTSAPAKVLGHCRPLRLPWGLRLSPYLDGLTASSAPRHPPLSARLPLALRPALPWAVMLAGRVPMAPPGVPTCRALGAGLRARATPGLRAPVVPALGLGLPRDTAPLPLGGWRPGPVRAARPPGGSSGGAAARSTASRGVAGARVLPAAPSSAANLGRAVMPVPPCRRGPGPGGGCLGGSWQSSSTAVESGGAAARGVLALVWVQFTR